MQENNNERAKGVKNPRKCKQIAEIIGKTYGSNMGNRNTMIEKKKRRDQSGDEKDDAHRDQGNDHIVPNASTKYDRKCYSMYLSGVNDIPGGMVLK